MKIVRKILFGLGINPRKTIKAILSLPWYFSQLAKFKSNCNWKMTIYPCLLDRFEQGGGQGEYFWQDIVVAKEVIALNPDRHIDIGSRLDGFIAHLACTRSLDVLDIRPIDCSLEGVHFHKVDIMALPTVWNDAADCVTSLHSVEHFGLGRYNDQLDVNSWKKGIGNISRIIRSNGILFLSTPIGAERIEFNAHRVFNPISIITEAKKNHLALDSLTVINKYGERTKVHKENETEVYGTKNYNLGIFKFVKKEL